MIERGEWGELYPAENSPFAYNKTLAFEYYPLTEEEAKKRNYKWEKDDKKEFLKQTYEIPDDIKDVDESICSQVLSCAKTGKNFKILPHELVYYKKMGLPIPRLHPDTRHFERMAKRTPRIFYQRQCMCVEPGHGHKGSCPNEFETTYAPDRPERVYCETCYQRVLSRQI
jgi:hypothetical protein